MTALPQVDVIGVGLNATDTLIPLPAYSERGSKIECRMGYAMPGGLMATVARHESACGVWVFE